MELGEVQRLISNAMQQMKSDQINLFVRWLDEKFSKYRTLNSVSVSSQMILPSKINHGQNFTCSCGRSFTTEITIRETSNVEESSPPATPMIGTKNDFKYQHQLLQTSPTKRVKNSTKETISSVIPTTALNDLIDRINPTSNLAHWRSHSLKNYEDSPELLHADSVRTESDIEFSSDESRCLEEIGAALSSSKTDPPNFIFASGLSHGWLSPQMSSCLNPYGNSHQEDLRINHQQQQQQQHHHHHHHHHSHHQQQQQQQQRQIQTLKPVSNEPLSPGPIMHQDEEMNKPLINIHRPEMLITVIHPNAPPNSGPTHFECNQCHETFDSLLTAQEHINNAACTADSATNMIDNSDSQLSPTASQLFDPLQENMEDALNSRPDSKAACPICNKAFSSVHTMIRHKTSIHDRQVRYGCNICGRFFFRKDKLTSHMVYHQDFNSYVCCICSSGFKSRMLMRQHLKRDHLMNNDSKNFNEILSQCQVKKSSHTPSSLSVSAFSASNDRQSMIVSKRSIDATLDESDHKPTPSN